MSDLRKAAEMALEALENPGFAKPKGVTDAIKTLRQALAKPEQEPVKFNCTVVDDDHPNGVTLSRLGRQPEHEPLEYKEECWACGCEECICATKVPGYYESKIKEAVLAEREACAKVCEEQITGYHFLATHGHFDHMDQAATNCAKAIRARGEK